MLIALLIIVTLIVLAAAYAGLVAFGSRVTALPYDPGYDTRRPLP